MSGNGKAGVDLRRRSITTLTRFEACKMCLIQVLNCTFVSCANDGYMRRNASLMGNESPRLPVELPSDGDDGYDIALKLAGIEV